jgi:hypothetical protein
VLADPDRYAQVATLPAGADDQTLAAAAHARRDLAIEGYLALRERVMAEGPAALADFHAAAAALVAARVPAWRRLWQRQALAVSALTGRQLDQIEALAAGHLAAGSLQRICAPAGPRSYGMCGRLTTYPAPAAR